MQHLIICMARGLDIILYRLNWILNICVSFFSIICASTYLYRTTTCRQEWITFMTLNTRGVIILFVLIVVESVLVKFIRPEYLSTILLNKDAAKVGKALGKEAEILGCVWLVTTTIGRLIRDGEVQGLTDDEWVASVYYTLFLTQWVFFACKFVYVSFVYSRISSAKI